MVDQAFTILAGSEPIHLASSVRQQPVAAADDVVITVVLRLPASAAALPSLEELSADKFRDGAIGRANYNQSYRADPADVAAVQDFAAKYGLEVKDVDLPARTVRLAGSAAEINTAFKVELNQYRSGSETYRSHDEPISIPADLKDVVKAVLGLSTRRAASRGHLPPVPLEETDRLSRRFVSPSRPRSGKVDEEAHPGIADDEDDGSDLPSNGDYPMNIAGLYGFPDGASGTGQSIAIIELGGGFRPQTLKTYFEKHAHIPLPTITAIDVDKGTNNSQDANAPEVYLDITVLGTIAHGSKINVYFAENTLQGFLLAVKAAIHDQQNMNSIVSISWGMSESTVDAAYVEAMNEAMHEAASLGITVCASSGDYGSADSATNADNKAHVNFPASSPFALSCGGTSVTRNAQGEIASEVVWNSGDQASGGGISAIFPPPPYQDASTTAIPSINAGAPAGRGVPDVAGCADRDTLGYFVLTDSCPFITVHGGTSAVAPLWAGLFALINEKIGKNVGFVNAALYSEKARRFCFRGVTSGTNKVGTTPGYVAGTGWNACTGLGSPIGHAILSFFEDAQSKNNSPAS